MEAYKMMHDFDPSVEDVFDAAEIVLAEAKSNSCFVMKLWNGIPLQSSPDTHLAAIIADWFRLCYHRDMDFKNKEIEMLKQKLEIANGTIHDLLTHRGLPRNGRPRR